MFWSKKKPQPYVYTWESEPFVFQPGMVYVIEWDVSKVRPVEVQKLANFFQEQGVIVSLVGTQDGKAFNPIKVKRKKESIQ
jgi:hypothetical protein